MTQPVNPSAAQEDAMIEDAKRRRADIQAVRLPSEYEIRKVIEQHIWATDTWEGVYIKGHDEAARAVLRLFSGNASSTTETKP